MDEKFSAEVVRGAVETAQDFLNSLFKPAAQELGNILGDNVRHWRFNNAVRITLEAKKLIEKHGIQLKQVSPTILLPILEQSSLADDESLQKKWVALLANAASHQSPAVHVSFPRVLSELTYIEAKIMDFLYVKSLAADKVTMVSYTVPYEDIVSALQITDEEYFLAIDHLFAVGLCVSSNVTVIPTFDSMEVAIRNTRSLVITGYGFEFIKACTEPS